MKVKTMLTIVVAAGLCSVGMSAMAATSVRLPFHWDEGFNIPHQYFYCTLTNFSSDAAVNIDTKYTEGKGMCSPEDKGGHGHLQGVTAQTLNSHYFELRKETWNFKPVTDSYVDIYITAGNGNLTCYASKPINRTVFDENGGGYCVMPKSK